MVPIERWGRDHWSILAYAECCTTDNRGELDRRRMRCNIQNHPLLAHLSAWEHSYGTRLKGYKNFEETPELLLPEHDDWDCLEDLEAEGLLIIVSLANGFVRFTAEGCDIAAQLREHKGKGGSFSDFEPILLREDAHDSAT